MSWVEIFAVLGVSHLVGDFLLQTDWQARHKAGGLGRDPVARRALVSHVAVYTLAFVPALVWLAGSIGGWALGVGALVALPHLVQDDCRLVTTFSARVKGVAVEPGEPVFTAVDQSLHALALFATALVSAS